jgi:hypothetical protein
MIFHLMHHVGYLSIGLIKEPSGSTLYGEKPPEKTGQRVVVGLKRVMGEGCMLQTMIAQNVLVG